MSRSTKKGPFVDPRLLKRIDALIQERSESSNQDLVEVINYCPSNDRAHYRGARWQAACPYLHN